MGSATIVLVKRAENWKYSSVWRREKGISKQKKLLSPWPVPEPNNYLSWLHEPQSQAEEEALERSIAKNIPFGADRWRNGIIKKYDLEQTIRPVGRPKKGG